MEKADAADAEERLELKKMKEEQGSKTGFRRLMPLQDPIYALYSGVILLGLSQINNIIVAIVFGTFMALMSTPMDAAVLMKLYPDTGETEGPKILET
jgi:hypothetical protein